MTPNNPYISWIDKWIKIRDSDLNPFVSFAIYLRENRVRSHTHNVRIDKESSLIFPWNGFRAIGYTNGTWINCHGGLCYCYTLKTDNPDQLNLNYIPASIRSCSLREINHYFDLFPLERPSLIQLIECRFGSYFGERSFKQGGGYIVYAKVNPKRIMEGINEFTIKEEFCTTKAFVKVFIPNYAIKNAEVIDVYRRDEFEHVAATGFTAKQFLNLCPVDSNKKIDEDNLVICDDDSFIDDQIIVKYIQYGYITLYTLKQNHLYHYACFNVNKIRENLSMVSINGIRTCRKWMRDINSVTIQYLRSLKKLSNSDILY